MLVSTFEIFKIGIGPSSSHTMGPMVAAKRFIDSMATHSNISRVTVTLRGSLAFTGRGHATDRAICLGLLGETPAKLDPDAADRRIKALRTERVLVLEAGDEVGFDPAADIIFDYGPPLPGHPNGMIFRVYDALARVVAEDIFYSVGGGFVLLEAELEASRATGSKPALQNVPFPFSKAAEMLEMGAASGLSIAAMQRANEEALLGTADLDHGLDTVWQTMEACIQRGLNTEGVLPGGLGVLRRAGRIFQALENSRRARSRPPHAVLDRLLGYALAVNEENAAGGRVVTAPTNGAAGVIPAVLKYYADHCPGATIDGVRDFLLTAAAIAGISSTTHRSRVRNLAAKARSGQPPPWPRRACVRHLAERTRKSKTRRRLRWSTISV